MQFQRGGQLSAEQNWNRIVSCFDPPPSHQPGWAAGTLPNFFHIVLKVWIEHLSLEFEHFALLHGMSKICCTCVCSAGLPAQILGDSAAKPRKFVLLASADARTRLKVQAHICPFVAALC